MTVAEKYTLPLNSSFEELNLLEGTFIVVLKATSVPPHIGMIVGGCYHSLSIKGQDIKTPVSALIKNIQLRAIPSLFIEIKTPAAFNEIYMMNRFIEKIKQFKRVDIGVATCLSPLKLYFEEEYAIPMIDIIYLYELLPRLEGHQLILNSGSLFIDENKYELPVYSMKQIDEEINQVRKEFT